SLALLIAATLLGKHVNVDGPYRLLISAVVTVVVGCGALLASRSWRANVLGQGAEEFRRLGRALVTAAVILALVSLAVGDGNGRPGGFLVIPTIAAPAAPQRYLLRRH